MSRKKKVALIAGILVVAYVGVTAFRARQHRNADVGVQVETVVRRDLVSAIAAGGRLEARRSVNISSADITGRIVKIAVHEGDTVQKGQFLLQIDPAQYETAVARAQWALVSSRASLVQSRAQLDQAKRAHERAQRLAGLGGHMIPAEEVEQAEMQVQTSEASYQSTEASLQQAEAELRDAQEKLAKTRLLAPMAGRITNLAVEEGEVAVTGAYSPQSAILMSVVDLSDMVAKVRVNETDAVRLSPNDSVVVTVDAFPDSTFVGRVTRIRRGAADASNQAPTSDFSVDIDLGKLPARMQPGLSCTTRIIVAVRPHTLSIPIIALTLRDHLPNADATGSGAGAGAVTFTVVGGQDSTPQPPQSSHDIEGVFKVRNGIVQFQAVTVGIVGDEHFEVLKGLREGDTIVSGSYQAIRSLHDGSRVRVVSEMPTTTFVIGGSMSDSAR